MISIPSGTKLGRYQIEKPLSERGGMASVFLASMQANSKFKAAIKIARTDSKGAASEDVLLQREAKLLCRSSWRHPSIVRLFPLNQGKSREYVLRATSVANDPWYMAMEYLQGLTLAQNKKKIEKYPLDWKIELFYQILVPVLFLHEKGFAHRDLKPDNIVFREPVTLNAIPQPVLVDFALATDGTPSYDAVIKSYTPKYSAREIHLAALGAKEGITDDSRPSDIWSLGVIFYEIITGNPLFKGSPEEIKTTIIEEQLEPQFAQDDDIHHNLAVFIRDMILPVPGDRPTIKMVISALEDKFRPPHITL